MSWHDRARRPVAVWWVPLLLVAVGLVGWTPLTRDLADYFVPMRIATSDALADGRIPWLNPDNGCGEPWFANPQTGVLYPFHWLYMLAPAGIAVAAEIALHLALLSAGLGIWTRRLGGSAVATRLAEAIGWSCGPVLAVVGMVNNLDALAWLPWMAITAEARQWRRLSLITALVWLAGEPHVWALSCLLAVVMAARHLLRAVVSICLGAALSAAQLIPFLVWVMIGNRGAEVDPRLLLSGGVDAVGWLAVIVPGLSVAAGSMWADSLLLGPVLVVCLFVGVRAAPLRLTAWAAVVAGLAVVPVLAGGELYIFITQGMTRYPSRFAVVALVASIPIIALGADRFVGDVRRWPALAVMLLAVLGVACADAPLALLLLVVTAVLAAVLVVAPEESAWRGALLVAAVVLLIVDGVPRLGLRSTAELATSRPVWTEPPADDRMHVPRPTGERFDWVLGAMERRRAWPIGYLNRVDGLRVTTTPAPVVPATLAEHLRNADSGPSGRWWLDALASPWVILPKVTEGPGLHPVAVRYGVWLHRNSEAWPSLGLASEMPQPGHAPHWLDGVEVVSRSPESLQLVVRVDEPSWLVVSQAPLPGWRWRIDHRPVSPSVGPGIVHGVPLEPGTRRVEARYRPSGVLLGAIVSLLAAGILAASVKISRRPSAVRAQLSTRDRSSDRSTRACRWSESATRDWTAEIHASSPAAGSR